MRGKKKSAISFVLFGFVNSPPTLFLFFCFFLPLESIARVRLQNIFSQKTFSKKKRGKKSRKWNFLSFFKFLKTSLELQSLIKCITWNHLNVGVIISKRLLFVVSKDSPGFTLPLPAAPNSSFRRLPSSYLWTNLASRDLSRS